MKFVFLVFTAVFLIAPQADAFNEKQLIRSMGQRNFSSSLMTSVIDIARDLRDKTGCLNKTNLNPRKDKFVVCDLKDLNPDDSRCHLINISTNQIEAAGPVSFGENGAASNPKQGEKQTGLGVYVTQNSTSKKRGGYYRHVVSHDGRPELREIGPIFKTRTGRLPASTEGSTMMAGKFAKVMKKQSGNIIWMNHSAKNKYDNACGMAFSRNKYESDMSLTQIANHRAKMKGAPQRGIVFRLKFFIICVKKCL